MTAHRDIGADRVEIDPEQFPILGRYWGAVELPLQHIGAVAERIVRRVASHREVDDDDHEAAT